MKYLIYFLAGFSAPALVLGLIAVIETIAVVAVIWLKP